MTKINVRTNNITTRSVVGAAGAVSSSIQSGYSVAAADSRKEGMEMQADSQEIQAFMQQLDDMIDQSLTLLMQSMDRFNAMLDSITDMAKDTADTMSATRFAG